MDETKSAPEWAEVAYWLPRASINALKLAKISELKKTPLEQRMVLIRAIDAEIFKRHSAIADIVD